VDGTFSYDGVTASPQAVSDPSMFFTLTDDANCPLSTCSVLADGCAGAYGGGHLSWDGLGFKADMNVEEGYTETVCIECSTAVQSNGADPTFQYSGMTITQLMSCGVALEVNSGVTKEFSQSYDAVTTTADVGVFSDFFTELESTCAVSGCLIKNQGCSDAYSGSHVSVAVATPWTLTVDRNVGAGYSETFCLVCSNGDQTV
jgi:hypothetical protein